MEGICGRAKGRNSESKPGIPSGEGAARSMAMALKNAGLKPLHGQARLLASRIGRVTYEHVPREQNRDADRLANLAMDEAERASKI